MLILKLLFLPLYFPFAIIIGILKLIGMVAFTNDVLNFFDK